MTTAGKAPSYDWNVFRGAPKPIAFRARDSVTGVLRSFDSTVIMRVTHPTGTFDMTVGGGLTLSTDETVANARITAQLTIAQSRLIPKGNLSSYEVQEGAAGAERGVFYGRLIGFAGDNPDA